MNKVTRTLAITGMAVAAGLTMGAGSASAAPAHPKPTPVSDHRADVQIKRVQFKGFYRSPRACVKAGRIGEIRRQWDDSRCDRVKFGSKRGWYALNVSWNVRSHGHGPINHHGPIKGHGPVKHHR